MNRRSELAVIVTIVAIVAGAAAVYLVSPLFISTKVDDALPAGAVQSESYQRFISMSEADECRRER